MLCFTFIFTLLTNPCQVLVFRAEFGEKNEFFNLFDNCSSFHSIFISHDFVFYTDAVFYFKIHFVYKFMQSSCVSRVPEKGNVKETP